MTHQSSIIINRTVAEGVDGATIDVVVTYRPAHGVGPKEIAKTVERITRRIDAIADAHPDE